MIPLQFLFVTTRCKNSSIETKEGRVHCTISAHHPKRNVAVYQSNSFPINICMFFLSPASQSLHKYIINSKIYPYYTIFKVLYMELNHNNTCPHLHQALTDPNLHHYRYSAFLFRGLEILDLGIPLWHSCRFLTFLQFQHKMKPNLSPLNYKVLPAISQNWSEC